MTSAQPQVKETLVDLPGQSNQRMAHVDDLLKGRPEQVRLPIIPRSRHPDAQCQIPQGIKSEIGQNRHPKSQENSLLNRAFLQKSLLARADKARTINGLPVLHGGPYRLTPWVANNQNAEVSHNTIRTANSTPPAMGSAQPG